MKLTVPLCLYSQKKETPPLKEETPPQKKETLPLKQESPPAVEVAAVTVEVEVVTEPVTRERSNTNPTITVESADGTTDEVTLRLPSDLTNKNSDNRKSGQ